MRQLYGMAAAILAASNMVLHDFYLDVRGRERQRNTSKTFSVKRGFKPDPNSIDLLGKSHGGCISKRKRQRAGAVKP